MSNIQIFKNPEFGEIKTVTIENEPWFVGKDVAEALGYANPKNAVPNHVDEEDKLSTQIEYAGQARTVTVINESGLYSLVLSSKLPSAKKFKRWVTSEVLPAIRKTGVYAAPTVDSEMMFKIAQAMQEKEQEIHQLTFEKAQQAQRLAEYEPKVQYLDKILSSKGTLATKQIAADYDLSAQALNKILHEEGIQYRVNDQWLLYRKHMGHGYTKSKTVQIVRSDGREESKMNTQWTQKGRLMIHECLKKRGILPVMDRGEDDD